MRDYPSVGRGSSVGVAGRSQVDVRRPHHGGHPTALEDPVDSGAADAEQVGELCAAVLAGADERDQVGLPAAR